MSFDPKVSRRVAEKLRERRARREEQFEARRERVYRESDEVRAIDAALRSLAIDAARLVLKGENVDETIDRLRARAEELRSERAELLIAMGKPYDYLDERDSCPHCGDTGYVGQAPCECFLSLYKKEQAAELSSFIGSEAVSFERFHFDLYSDEANPYYEISPRANAEWVFDTCSDYARSFSVGGPGDSGKDKNLFINGAAGLGKTFLSACIAKVVVEKGFSVVYESAVTLFMRFEQERFGRGGEENAEEIRRYLLCDLLILDDLGCEAPSNFTAPTLYNVINTRLSAGLRTVINTNLATGDLSLRYSSQIDSRVNGLYTTLHLFGDDIRKKLV